MQTTHYSNNSIMHFLKSQPVKSLVRGGGNGGGDTVKSAPCRKRLNAAKHRTTTTVKRRLPVGPTYLQAGLEWSFGCGVVEARGYLLLGELLEAPVLHEHGVDASPGSRSRQASVFLLDSLDHSCHRGTVPRRTRRINAAAEDRALHQAPRVHL